MPALATVAEVISARVQALPQQSVAEQTKKAVLAIAVERTRAALDAALPDEANALVNDIESALAASPDTFAQPCSDPKTLDTISSIRPIQCKVNNPYLDRMMATVTLELAKPDMPFLKNTATLNNFSGLRGTKESVSKLRGLRNNIDGTIGSRDAGDELQGWLWLLANPNSPLKGDPRVLQTFLRLAHAYVDAINVHGGSTLEKHRNLTGGQGSKGDEFSPLAGQGIFDDFAIAPAVCGLREFAQLYPAMLLPSQKASWDRAMNIAARIMWDKAKDRNGTYCNIDLCLAHEFLNFGLYLNNSAYLDKAKFLWEAQDRIIYPDGGTAYLGHQNESANYHDAVTDYFGMIYQINQDPKLFDMIRKTEWYGPVSCGKLSEFWTVPSWKETWNDSSVFPGTECVLSATGNAYLKTMRQVVFNTHREFCWASDVRQIPWYRDDIKAQPLPDNYTVIDRNIAGPRAWYGRFTYAATLRPIPQTEPGIATLMGAMVITPGGSLDNILMGAYPRVQVRPLGKSESIQSEGSSYAWLTSGLKSAVVMGRSFSAISGNYRLHQFASSLKGPDVDWNGRQVWLGLPDRIIGLLEVSPSREDAKAFDVEGVLRLGTGGTVNGAPTKIEDLGKNTFRYRDLTVTILAHNYARIETREVPFRLPKFPVTEIRCLDDPGAQETLSPSVYGISKNFWFLVEIKPSYVSSAATVTQVKEPAGVSGFQVNLDSKQFVVLENSTNAQLRCPVPDKAAVGDTSLFESSSSPSPLPVSVTGSTVTVMPGQLDILTTSTDTRDHLRGWENYEEMAGQVSKPN